MPLPALAVPVAGGAVKLITTGLDRLMGGGPERWSWRRLILLAVATYLFHTHTLDQEGWVHIAQAYVGGDVVVRSVQAIAGRRKAASEAPTPRSPRRVRVVKPPAPIPASPSPDVAASEPDNLPEVEADPIEGEADPDDTDEVEGAASAAGSRARRRGPKRPRSLR